MKKFKKFGVLIKERRKAAGLSQEKLAELCDMSLRQIVNVEHGKANLRLCNLLRLCRAIGIDCGELAQFYIPPYEDADTPKVISIADKAKSF